jgi:hypothetical protein
LNDRDLDSRHLVDADGAVIVEIRLENTAAFSQRHFAEQDGAEAEADPAFHLGADEVGVDRHAAIHRAPDLVHPRKTVFAFRNLGDLRDIGLEALMHGDAARTTFRHRAAPIGNLRNAS